MPRGGFRAGKIRGAIDSLTDIDNRGIGLGGGICKVLYGTSMQKGIVDKELQRQALQNRAAILQSELDMINNHLKELSAETK